MRRPLLGLALALALTGAGGCGARQFDVSGKVRYNGAAFDKPDGQIVFVGPHGEQVATAINPDGSYRATGVAAGTNRVVVYYPNPKAKVEKGAKLRPGQTPASSAPLYLTPAKYASPDTSDLSLAVDKETTFDVDMTGPPVR
jgi:hypothetical protein